MVSPIVLAALGAGALYFAVSKKKTVTGGVNLVTGKSGTVYRVQLLTAGTPAKGINTYRVFIGANPVLDYMHDTNTGKRALIGAISQGPNLNQTRADFGV